MGEGIANSPTAAAAAGLCGGGGAERRGAGLAVRFVESSPASCCADEDGVSPVFEFAFGVIRAFMDAIPLKFPKFIGLAPRPFFIGEGPRRPKNGDGRTPRSPPSSPKLSISRVMLSPIRSPPGEIIQFTQS